MSAARRGAADGMALLEVLVAVVLLAVTLLGVGRSQMWAAREGRRDAQYEQAYAAALSVAGLLRAGEPAGLVAKRLASWREAGTAALPDAELALVERRPGEPAFVVVHWAGAGSPGAVGGGADGGAACRPAMRRDEAACLALAF